MRLIATTALALALSAWPALAQDTPSPAPAPAIPAQTTPAPGTPATAPRATPDASDLLFEQPQLRNAAPGSTLRYGYLRRSGIAKGPFGPLLEDAITLALEPGKSPDARDIRVAMFTGLNRVPAGPFEDMAGNPVVSLFLENHLKGLARVLEANPRYLKLAIRKGLRERATVEPTTVSVAGREVPGWRIVTRPFEGDAMSARMRGLDSLTYTFVTAPGIPGEIVSMEASARARDGGELLEERVRYDPQAS